MSADRNRWRQPFGALLALLIATPLAATTQAGLRQISIAAPGADAALR